MRKWKKYVAICLVLALAGTVPSAGVRGDVVETGDPAGNADDPQNPGGEPSTGEPSTGEPSTGEPSTGEPSTGEPSTGEPSSQEPSSGEPSSQEPSSGNPSSEDSSTENPTTEEKPEIGPWPGYDPAKDAEDPSKAANKEDKAGQDASPGVVVVQTVVSESGNEVYNAEAIAALQQQALKIKEQKLNLQTELKGLLTSQNDYISKLKALDEKILEYEDKLDAMEEQKAICEATIADLKGRLEEAQKAEQEQYEALKFQIQNEYENENASIYDFLFQSIEFYELINRVEYVSEVNSYEDRKLTELTDARRSIADQKLMMETMINDIGVIEEGYREQQDILQMYSDAKARQIEEYQADIDTAKAGIATLEQLEKQQTTAIAQLEASFRATTTYVKYTYTGDKMLWPMPSSGQISSYFGYRNAPNVAGATSDHRGIDIPCDEGSPCIAAADGVVMYTGYMGTGGNAVLIDCGSGITIIYYHLSGFNVTVGQQVKAGDVVAFSGNTGASTGPHLHFGVRINGEYQDPLDFLF